VNVGATFKANAKTTKVMEPCVSTLDHPSKFAETATVFGPALCEHRLDAAFAQFPAMWFGVVAAIGVNNFGLLKRPATCTADRLNGIDERQQLGNVVAVRAGQDGTDGDAIRIDKDVMLGTGSRAIRGVRASFSPAPTARTDDESTAAREKSSWPASRSFTSISWCSRSHTPAFCQSCKRRQQVEPEPYPNLIDRSHQRIPVLNTNRMPFSAARSETRRRPGYFLRRGFGGGSKGSINAHSSSSMIGVPIPLVPVVQMAKVNSLLKRLTAPSGSF
jgi:hypothetical protein